MDRIYATITGISPGDELQIQGRKFKVVGYMTRPDYIYTLKSPGDLFPSPSGFGMAVISQDDFANLSGSQSFYSVIFNRDNRAEFLSHLTQGNTVLNWLDREDNPRIGAVEPDLRAKETIGNILPTFILLVTCLIIAVVLWRLLKNEFVQIGTLYALGYRKTDILRHYLVYPLALALSGGILGTILGVWLALPLIMVTDGLQYNFPAIQVVLLPWVLAASLLLPLVFLLPTTWWVVGRALKLSPLQLMRGAGSNTKIGFLEKRLRLNRFSFDTKFRIRELVRNIPRAAAMVAGITFASCLLLIGFVMNDSIRDIVEGGYDELYKFDYQYVLRGLETEPIPGAERKNALPVVVVGGEREQLITAYGVEPGGILLNLTNAQGARISHLVSVSQSLADVMELKPGDRIIQVTIQEIANTYLGYSLYMPLDQFNEALGLPQDSYSILLSREPLALEAEQVAAVITREELRQAFQEMVKMLRGLIIGMGSIAVFIGMVIIFILTSLLIEENRYNISLMKVSGYGKNKIFSLVLNTTFGLVVAGFALAVPLIRWVSDSMFAEITEEMSMTIPAVIDYRSIILGLAIILTSYWVSNFVNRRKVWAVSMADSLKNREE